MFFVLLVFSYNAYFQNNLGGFSLGVGGSPIGLNNGFECGLYNPAAFAGSDRLSVFAAHGVTRGEKRDSMMLEQLDYLWQDTSKVDCAFLDFLGFVLPFKKDYFFSLSLSVPYRSVSKRPMSFTKVDDNQQGSVASPGEYIESEQFYFLNPTLGKTFNEKFAVALNMGLFWKRSSLSFETDDPEFSDVATTMDKYGVEPCLGLQYEASDIFSFGVLLKKGFGEAYKENNGRSVSSIESDESLPLVVSFGAGINLKDKVYVNVSAEYLQWMLAYSEGYVESNDYRNTVKLHLGGQYKFNDLLSLSMGFYTDPYPVVLSSVYDSDSYDQMFLTGGVGLDFGKVALNLGAASSAIIKKDPSLREENHFNLSLSYK
jgi:hypothetical protein